MRRGAVKLLLLACSTDRRMRSPVIRKYAILHTCTFGAILEQRRVLACSRIQALSLLKRKFRMTSDSLQDLGNTMRSGHFRDQSLIGATLINQTMLSTGDVPLVFNSAGRDV